MHAGHLEVVVDFYKLGGIAGHQRAAALGIDAMLLLPVDPFMWVVSFGYVYFPFSRTRI
jgi:hypothetical protein